MNIATVRMRTLFEMLKLILVKPARIVENKRMEQDAIMTV
jgi:hypothetical protein